MKDMADKDFCKDVKSYLTNVSFKEKAALEEFLTEAIRRLEMVRAQNFPSAATTQPAAPSSKHYVNAKIDPYKISYYTFMDECRAAFGEYRPAKGNLSGLSREDIRYETTDGTIAVYNPVWEPKS